MTNLRFKDLPLETPFYARNPISNSDPRRFWKKVSDTQAVWIPSPDKPSRSVPWDLSVSIISEDGPDYEHDIDASLVLDEEIIP